jgi:indolepyruvate ferredoxin oxidoreductase
VEGGQLRKGKRGARLAGDDFPALPEPAPASLDEPCGVLVTGIGGTGVITIGQILGMAAHLEGKGVSVLDMSGLAQKYGAVMSHVKIASSADQVHLARLGTGDARVVIGCDLVVSASGDALDRMSAGRTRAVVNGTTSPTAAFVSNPDWQLPGSNLQHDIAEACGGNGVDFVPATEVATALMGDSIATNMFMLGYAWQKGWVPLGREALERSIELNGVAVDFNMQSFLWGRRAAVDFERVRRIALPADVVSIERHFSRDLAELVERRAQFLTGYQNAAYAERYRALVERVRVAEQNAVGDTRLAEAVARYYAKLLAYKDEYEVARLYTTGEFRKKIESMFEGDFRMNFHLAPPLLAKSDPLTGEPRKMQFGPWMLSVFGLLAKLRGLRGTPLDVFGRTAERRMERALIGEYEATVAVLLQDLSRERHATAVEIASLPEEIRGYGHVKSKSVAAARRKQAELLSRYQAAPVRAAA